MNQNFDTGLSSLARFVHEKQLLLHNTGGTPTSLQYRSIRTLMSNVWNEMRQEEEQKAKTRYKNRH